MSAYNKAGCLIQVLHGVANGYDAKVVWSTGLDQVLYTFS